jgi:hypothetical protein
MNPLDLDAFRSTPLVREPFEYLIVPGFVVPEARAAIHADYPRIEQPGSFPVSGLRYGRAFASLLETLQGPEFRIAVEAKFRIDLSNRATMITARGRCSEKDGSIHTDSRSKIITVLVYMNPKWESRGGCLRLLRSPDDLEDVVAEVPPIEGTLVTFRRSDNSYHGHLPFAGPRRVIQFNWVTSRTVARRELLRHRMSAWMKSLSRLFRPTRAAT